MRPAETTSTADVARLGQYLTPNWAAECLVEEFFRDLTSNDHVLEPTCGAGAFLAAIPPHVPALGVEIDPVLAREAVRNTGREVIVGDIRTCELPIAPTAIVGNPPFAKDLILQLLERSHTWLPDEGRVGLILPAFVLATPATTVDLSRRWDISQSMLPRNLWPRLQHPLCFALFRKGARRGLVGFSLMHQRLAVQRLPRRYQELLAEGEGSTWVAITRAALEVLGGRATLADIYDEIQGHRPTENAFWKAKIRQTLQRIAVRVGAGTWALPDAIDVAA